MKLFTIKAPVKKNTLQKTIFLALILFGSGMIAASLYRHYSPDFSGKINSDTLQVKKPASPDSAYKISMRNGDVFMNAKEYINAITEYETGLKLKPKDPYASAQLAKAKTLLEARMKADQDYTKSIASGDLYFKSKDYINAKASYQLAIDAKPEDEYARTKLKETMDLLRSMKASNILYDVAIASAEKLYQQKDYEKAMAEFGNAAKILPNEKYPKDRINEIIKIMIDKQTKDEMYTQSIAAADKYYNSKGYQNALLEYQHAASYKPEEQYPKDRIKELTALLAAMKARDEAYKKSIAIADKFFDGASYEPSKSEYQNASKIKPEEIYPVNRIKEIDIILARLKNAKEEYERLVNLADSFYVSKKYINAKSDYQQALQVKPNESYPKDMIAKCDNLISGQEANSKALEEAYQAALSAADKLYTAKEYDKAKAGYQGALGIKPDEQYPKDKIKEIDGMFASLEKQKQLDKQYLDLIAAADKLLADKSYQPAKLQYQAALQVKPDESYPKDRIKEIDLALGDLAKQKALDDQYAAALVKADKSFAARTWDQARTDYTGASALKPNEAYPKDKILEIQKIQAEVAAQKAIDDQYAVLLVNAEKLLAAKTYAEARTEYSKAGDLKPSEEYPKLKIAAIDKILADLEAQKSKEEQYKTLIDKADKLLADLSYEPAKAEYQNAALLKPAEAYPKGKIVEINAILDGIAKKKALDDQYATIITNADKLLADKSYAAAKVQYQSASKLKPAEKYPVDRIAEIDLALADLAKQKALDDQYAAVIAKADRSFAAKTWDQAKTDYSAASTLKPNESYPKDKILEIDKILADLAKQKALDDQYAAVVANADKLLLAKTYAEARTEYGKAGDLKPAEAYPKTKIAEIDKILADIEAQKSKEEQYKTLIDKADKLLTDKSYEPAKTEYQNALVIKPAEAYPKGKIAEIDKVLADIAKKKALDDQYASTLANADKLLADKSYQPAKSEYSKASLLKPEEKYPKDRIAEIDLALADLAKQKALDDQYAAAISKADKSFAAKTWEQAKTDYSAASVLKPNEAYPKEKIVEIEKILSDIANQKALDAQYAAVVANADKLLLAKSYADAKSAYGKAGELKPAEAYPKTKIAEIDKILADIEAQKSKEEQYKTLIDKADKLLTDKSYEPAKTEYQNALVIKPAEAYPKGKITEIDNVLAEIAKKKALDDQYAATITNADKLLADKSYSPARAEYQKASLLKPLEKYPKDRIAEIDLALADLAKQKALDDQYAAAIAKADKSFMAKTWAQAKTDYMAASQIKPSETYPKDKISEIDKTVADIAKQKALDDQYNSIIANADKLLLAKSYPDAKGEYAKAGDLKPSEAYPKTKIAEIDKILADIAAQKSKDEQYKALIDKADKLLTDKSYEPAKTEYQNALVIKPAEAYPKGKITEIDNVLAEIAKKKALDDQYAATIANADKLLSDKSWEPAKAEYQKASLLKPVEKYPKDRIVEIDLALANLAKQKALDDQYAAVIGKADKLLLEKSYEPARTEYTSASALKPNEQYPKDKIAEIAKALDDIAKQKVIDQKYLAAIATGDRLLDAKTYDLARAAYTDASGLKPAEQYPKDKIALIDKTTADIAHQKEVDAQYKSSVAKADQLLLSKSYEPAKTEYQNAVSLRQDDPYAKGKIAAIEKILADIKAFEDKYNGAIATGDTAFRNKLYAQAKAAYQGALQMKPAEKYPKDKLADIDKIQADLAKQKVIDDQYTGSVSKADKLLADKSYALAKTEYGNASSIKPGEQYPKDKIAEIDGIVADLKAKDDAYKTSVAKANQLMVQKSYEEARTEYQTAGEIKPNEQYPKDKIAEINKILMELKGKRQTYDELVAKGNDLLSIKDFYKAKDNFQQALSIFPDESYPKDRLIRINSVIDSIFRANKVFYDRAIAEGDKNYNSMIYDKAIDSYQEAVSYLPMEQYPKDMINKIKRTIAENAIVDVLNSAQTVSNGVEKQFDFAPVNIISRKNNYLYIKIRNLSNKPFNVMLRYGKDKQVNGGGVIKNLSGDGKVNERLISVREQDPWYRNDNNWISLYPQGGDVEVTFIQISRSTQ
ncbi:MAG: hypothetical protein NTW10_11885 [Bacteroidetes bacterium]|nr:hypothetical protein [Bacteroidota bacterium]